MADIFDYNPTAIEDETTLLVVYTINLPSTFVELLLGDASVTSSYLVRHTGPLQARNIWL